MNLTLIVALCLALLLAPGAQAEPKPLGLAVRGGSLIKDGKPFRGIGVNYFDAFYRTLGNPKDTSYREGFKVLKEHGIPFARFMACGYWPTENALYLTDKQAYFKLMDGVVKSAEEHGVGLIPSFFFCYSTVPDIVGEPMMEWGNPRSKTIAFMRRYTREMVTRYRNSPAIWGWEFGNEFMLQADLNSPEHRPPVWPTLGTAKTRSKLDELTSEAARYAQTAFAEEVRKLDKDRIILSGNAFPRASAWHLSAEQNWKQDTNPQFADALLCDNADPMNVICVHLYPDFLTRFDRALTYAELLRVAIDIAAKAGKPLFVEEFGTDEATGPAARTEFEKMLSAIEKTHVGFAALWVYDFEGQKDTYNVSATNSRAYQLDAISKANRQLQEEPH